MSENVGPKAYEGMKRTTLSWGLSGAGAIVALAVLLHVIQGFLPYDSAVRGLAHSINVVVDAPVLFVWYRFFDLFGIHGDQQLGYAIPLFASKFLYVGVVGFCCGALLGKMTRVA